MSNLDWMKQGAIYHIFIDRFAGFHDTKNWDSPVFLGGTIKGIIDKLPYLRDLGITTLWISPFYTTSAYHGYHITDFYQVDPHFGTQDDIKELIRESHDSNLHIIADFVPNHCSKEHPFFKEAQHDKNSQVLRLVLLHRLARPLPLFPECERHPETQPQQPTDTRSHHQCREILAEPWVRRLPPRPCHRSITDLLGTLHRGNQKTISTHGPHRRGLDDGHQKT